MSATLLSTQAQCNFHVPAPACLNATYNPHAVFVAMIHSMVDTLHGKLTLFAHQPRHHATEPSSVSIPKATKRATRPRECSSGTTRLMPTAGRPYEAKYTQQIYFDCLVRLVILSSHILGVMVVHISRSPVTFRAVFSPCLRRFPGLIPWQRIV